jgi:hypothetical protein
MQGRTETLVFLVSVHDFQTFVEWVGGKSTYVVGVGTVRQQPLQNPYFTRIYAIGIDYETMGNDTHISLTRPWSYMKCVVKFGTLPWDPNGSTPYFTVRYRGTTSVATVPGAKLHFSTGEYIDHDYGILLGQYAIEIMLYQVPDIQQFLDTYGPLMGQTNNDNVTILGYEYDPGYLLLNTVDAEMQVNSLGGPQNQATVSLIVRSIPWNSDIDSNGTVQEVLPHPYQDTAYAGAFS